MWKKNKKKANQNYGKIEYWNTKKVISIKSLFSGMTKFNKNLQCWDTSNVKDMSDMFLDAKKFNGNVSAWDVSKVTKMFKMFMGATRFNVDVSVSFALFHLVLKIQCNIFLIFS